jgi:hypothetical protein
VKQDPDKPVSQEDREPFLSRWSRKKEEVRQAQPEPVAKPAGAESPKPELPPVDKLTIDSDYRAFFHPKVGEDVRRAALKKLFSDPRFNIMDGLDVYIDDYSKTEPIPPEMLAGLRQAQNILQWAKEDAEERARKECEKGQGAPGEPARAGELPASEAPPTEPESAAPSDAQPVSTAPGKHDS